MQLSSRPTLPTSFPDVPAALTTAAGQLGHRPAITVLHPDRREEQSVASLAQWTSKGSHMLELDVLLERGDQLLLDAPAGWGAAAVALAAWWAGITVVLPDDAAATSASALQGRAPTPHDGVKVDAAVVHDDRATPVDVPEVFRLGDAVDGTPVRDVDGEPWATAVQTFPDQPPVPRGGGDDIAIVAGDRSWTHAQVLAEARALGSGTYGLEVGDRPRMRVPELIALAVRPLVVGNPTVVLRAGVARDAATGEKVTIWQPPLDNTSGD